MNFKLATRSYGLLSFLLICPITALSSASVGKSVCGAAAKLAAIALDKKAIEEMSGCYTVDYSFKETRSLQPNYEKKPEYHVQSLEYISCEQRGENRRKLQHLLKAGPFIKIHHCHKNGLFAQTSRLHTKGKEMVDTVGK